MDRRERMSSLLVAVRGMLRGWQGTVWTALPAIVQSYDPAKLTVVVQPAIQAQILDPKTGQYADATLPLCMDCPVQWPGGGGYVLTFPLAAGDEGVLVFASRCIDAWWQSGGVQKQAELRMHDLSDGIFIPMLFSNTKVPANVSTENVQLRSADGNTLIEMAAGNVVNIKAVTVNVQGNLAVTGEITWPNGVIGGSGAAMQITGDVQATGDIQAGHGGIDQVGLKTHTHAAPIGGNTSAPNAGT